MGLARWRFRRVWSAGAARARRGLGALLINDLTYPIYGIALGGPWAGVVGNVLTLLLALAFIVVAWQEDRVAALLVAPQIPWIALATLGTLQQFGRL